MTAIWDIISDRLKQRRNKNMKNKISLYDIVNKFFVGAVFTLLLVVVTVDKLPLVDIYNHYSDILKDWSVIVSAVLLIAMYEIGFVINRGSSAIIAPFLEKTKIWPKEDYTIDISEIKKSNETFNAMITELVLSRSHIFMYLLLTIISFACCKWIFGVVFVAIILLFIISGRKHNQRINKIRKDYAARKEEQSKKELKNFLTFDGNIQGEKESGDKNGSTNKATN